MWRKGRVQLCLDARLDNVERTGNDTGHTTGAGTGEDFQGQADFLVADPGLGHFLLFLIKGKLKCGEGEIAGEGGLVSGEELGQAFETDDGAEGVKSAAIVVTGVEEGVVVAALELQARFEDFAGHVEGGGGEVGEEAF